MAVAVAVEEGEKEEGWRWVFDISSHYTTPPFLRSAPDTYS